MTSNISIKLQRIGASINKSSFVAKEALLGYLSRKPKMKILFPPKSERENNIRQGFRFSKHQIEFNELSPENISKSDLIVPLAMWELRDMIKVAHLLKNNPIPIPSLQAVNICDDKYLFIQTLEQKGFGYVLPKIGHPLPYPYMLKKKVAQSGDDCFIISTPEREKELEALINSPEFFCQEIVQGKNEYATHILFKNHKIVSSININYVFANDTFVKGKDKFICTKICKCPYLDTFAAILEAIGFEGLCCFNYKVIDGKPLVLEINPRFGGSLSTFFFSFIRKL